MFVYCIIIVYATAMIYIFMFLDVNPYVISTLYLRRQQDIPRRLRRHRHRTELSFTLLAAFNRTTRNPHDSRRRETTFSSKRRRATHLEDRSFD